MNTKILIGIIASIVLVTFSIGCVEEESTNGDLSISNVVFCSEHPTGYREYKEQPDATYNPGDMVWIYMNINNNYYNPNSDGTNEIWITENLTLLDSQGEILIPNQEFLNEHQNYPEDLNPENLWIYNNIPTSTDIDPGYYTVQIVVKDKLAGATATASSTFRIVL